MHQSPITNLQSLPSGVYPVMLTPFTAQGALDDAGLDALIEWYLEAGVSGLFAVCLSSEMYALAPEERLRLAARVVRRADGRVPVLATGTFGGTPEEQAAFTRQISETGVSAVVVITSQLAAEGESEATFLQRMDELLHLTAGIDLGLYECPAPYKRVLSAQAYGQLARTGRFVFYKDTTCNADAMRAKLTVSAGTRMGLYNANTPTALDTLRAGAAGVSCIAANVFPSLLVWLCSHWHTHPQEAQRLQHWLTVMDQCVGQKYPAAAKRMLGLRGLPITPNCRTGNPSFSTEDTVMHTSLMAICDQLAHDLTFS